MRLTIVSFLGDADNQQHLVRVVLKWPKGPKQPCTRSVEVILFKGGIFPANSKKLPPKPKTEKYSEVCYTLRSAVGLVLSKCAASVRKVRNAGSNHSSSQLRHHRPTATAVAPTTSCLGRPAVPYMKARGGDYSGNDCLV